MGPIGSGSGAPRPVSQKCRKNLGNIRERSAAVDPREQKAEDYEDFSGPDTELGGKALR